MTYQNLLFRNYTSFNIQKIRPSCGDDLANSLVALHAYTGCDATSTTFHIRKHFAFFCALEDNFFWDLLSSFISPNLSSNQVEHIGLKLMVILFNGNREESIKNLKYKSILLKVKKLKAL